MKFERKSIAIGVAAGLAAALLSVGSAVQTSLSFILFLIAPLPVMVAGLGWGPGAALGAVATAALAVSSFASPLAGLAITATITLPAAIMAHFASLAQSSDDGRLAWFPLSGVLFRAALAIAAAFVIAGVAGGYSSDFIKTFATELINQIAAGNPQAGITDEVKAQFASTFATLVPYVQPATWLLIILFNFYVALHISRASGQLRRPRDYWPSELRLPKIALPVMAVALALSFLGGAVGTIAAVFAGAFLMAFSVVGLAVFHKYAATKSWRVPGLSLTYIGLALVGFLIIPFLFAGLITTARQESSSTTNQL